MDHNNALRQLVEQRDEMILSLEKRKKSPPPFNDELTAQLSEQKITIEELKNEVRSLKSIQQVQSKALKTYDNALNDP